MTRFWVYLRWASGKRDSVVTAHPEDYTARRDCRVLACLPVPVITIIPEA